MFNPYRGNNPSVTRTSELWGREDAFQELENHIKNRRSVVVMGVEGVGKSSLLACYFNLKYRQKMALDRRTLIRVTDFPVDRDADEIYRYLAEGVISAIDALDQEETQAEYRALRAKCANKMAECQDEASRFQQVCEVIQEHEYHITLVIDGFERFVSSPHVRMEHHDLMNTLISKNLSFVVATNYDFNQDSLPAMVSGSFLLMKFAGNEVRLKGLSEASCAGYLRDGGFADSEIHQLYILSGGIPTLLRRAAEHTLDRKQDGTLIWKQVMQETYGDVCPLLARWCRLLSKNQVAVMNFLARQEKGSFSFEDATWNTAAKALLDRGLLANPIEASTGRSIAGQYRFSTPLLKLYCQENTLRAESIGEKSENLEDALKEALQSEKKEQVIELYREIAREAGFPMPVNFQEDLTDELLQEFQLSRAVLESFDQSVQDFICTGILVERTFTNVKMLDFSPSYISFAKAIEKHLNLTLVPVLKLIFPDVLISSPPGKQRKLKDMDHMMLGQISNVLGRGYSALGVPFISEAGRYCTENLKNFPETWWRKIRDDLNTTKDIRNDMPHPEFLSGEEGKKFLRLLFVGQKSFFRRCQDLYDAAKKQGLL